MAPGADITTQVPYNAFVLEKGSEETAEIVEITSNIQRVGVQSNVLARLEEKRFIRKLMATNCQQRREKRTNVAGETSGSHFLLPTDMESNIGSTNSRGDHTERTAKKAERGGPI